MSKNRALGKKAGNQQSEASSRNFFWGEEIRDLTPSCLGPAGFNMRHVITDHICRDGRRKRRKRSWRNLICSITVYLHECVCVSLPWLVVGCSTSAQLFLVLLSRDSNTHTHTVMHIQHTHLDVVESTVCSCVYVWSSSGCGVEVRQWTVLLSDSWQSFQPYRQTYHTEYLKQKWPLHHRHQHLPPIPSPTTDSRQHCQAFHGTLGSAW